MPDIELQAYLSQIEGLIKEAQPDEAIVHCQHILRYYPKHVRTYRALGSACLTKGMNTEALDLFYRTLSADPEDSTVWRGVSSAYQAQEQLDEALWALERAFALAPGEPEVRMSLERLYSPRSGAGPPKLIVTRDALGRIYARNGLGEKAIVEFQAVLDQNPDLPEVRVALLETLWREGRYFEAAEACLQILEGLPYCLKANLVLGAIRTYNGQQDAGRARLDVACALDPENLMAQATMAEASPLPLMSALVPRLASAPILSDEAPEETRAPELGVPAWARELESIENHAPAAGDDPMEKI
jgi:tetratricopeptide (TPR) repeat protein